jgi:hypothetical protein
VPENSTTTINLFAVELGSLGLENATLEITENPLFGITGTPVFLRGL